MSEPTTQTAALQGIPFFSGLSSEELEGVLEVARPVSFDAGSAIVTEGDPGDGMYVLLDGAAEVDVGGRYHKLGPGDFIGEMALISARKRMATVKATEAVDALRIPAETFRSFLLEHPAVALSMLESLVERLREVQQRIDAWMA